MPTIIHREPGTCTSGASNHTRGKPTRTCTRCYVTMKPVYLDYNATTPIDPAVRVAMLPYLDEQFGNPSSAHEYGRQAHAAVDKARGQMAGLIGAEPDEIVFTGGGIEASNLAIQGVAFASLSGSSGRLFSPEDHILTSAII